MSERLVCRIPKDLENQALQDKEVKVREEITQTVKNWQRQRLPKEDFEYIDLAIDLFTDALMTGIPVPIISPTCANYETMKFPDGSRHPTIHKQMVWNDRGLRRGGVLWHEEVPFRLKELVKLGVPIQYLVVVVDLGMSETLFSKLNPDVAGLPYNERVQYISSVVDDNVRTILRLLTHGLGCRGLSTGGEGRLDVRVERLTNLIADLEAADSSFNFMEEWNNWNRELRHLLGLPDNRWAGLIRDAIEKDGRYLREAWGLEDEEEIIKRVVDDNFGLTAAFADSLPWLVDVAYGRGLEDRSQVVLLDTIPGPKNPGHKEFYAYNLGYPNGEPRPQLAILRPYHSLVLVSAPAIEVDYLGKSLIDMQKEANEYGL